ncbi:MAG: DUF1175 domain-containing protein [Acidobacteria bacterium]|nr:DUF1175 domain-containing protein [Acidobacteriota bacterium]
MSVEGLPASASLADESDRAAFRLWFTLLADLQFERAAAEVTDCAALVHKSASAWWMRRYTPSRPTTHQTRCAFSIDGSTAG